MEIYEKFMEIDGKFKEVCRSLWKLMEIHGNLEKKFIEIDGKSWKVLQAYGN